MTHCRETPSMCNGVRRKCYHCDHVSVAKDFDALVAADREHSSVCPKRPIEVGDYVEWREASTHVAGEVVSVDGAYAEVSIMFDRWAGRPSSWVGKRHLMAAYRLRRIPRPAKGETTAQVATAGTDGCDHLLPWREWPEGWRCNGCGQLMGGEPPAPPDPAPIDGLTAEDCLRLFVSEMREDPSSVADLRASGYYRLTSAQLVAARALWAERLRAKVSARERGRTTGPRIPCGGHAGG